MGRKTPQNLPFPLGHVDHRLIHQCLGPPHSSPKRHPDPISRFFHSSFTGQTDRWQCDKPVRIPAYAHIVLIESDAANNNSSISTGLMQAADRSQAMLTCSSGASGG